MGIINKISGLLGVLCIAVLGYECIDTMKQSRSIIQVYGLADKIVESDHAIMTIKVREEGNSLNVINEKLDKSKYKVQEFLIKQGFKESEITDRGTNIEDDYQNWRYSNSSTLPTNRYKVEQIIRVESDNIDLVRNVNSNMSKLLSENIFVNVNTKYSCKDYSKIRLQLIEEATADAEARAQSVAKATGCKIHGLRRLSTGKFNILDGDDSASDSREWSDGENSYTKRFRIIIDAVYNKD